MAYLPLKSTTTIFYFEFFTDTNYHLHVLGMIAQQILALGYHKFWFYFFCNLNYKDSTVTMGSIHHQLECLTKKKMNPLASSCLQAKLFGINCTCAVIQRTDHQLIMPVWFYSNFLPICTSLVRISNKTYSMTLIKPLK